MDSPTLEQLNDRHDRCLGNALANARKVTSLERRRADLRAKLDESKRQPELLKQVIAVDIELSEAKRRGKYYETSYSRAQGDVVGRMQETLSGHALDRATDKLRQRKVDIYLQHMECTPTERSRKNVGTIIDFMEQPRVRNPKDRSSVGEILRVARSFDHSHEVEIVELDSRRSYGCFESRSGQCGRYLHDPGESPQRCGIAGKNEGRGLYHAPHGGLFALKGKTAATQDHWSSLGNERVEARGGGVQYVIHPATRKSLVRKR